MAMLSMEKRLICEMTDFSQQVIETFADQKERKAKYMFKLCVLFLSCVLLLMSSTLYRTLVSLGHL